jgi:hypothetical protein
MNKIRHLFNSHLSSFFLEETGRQMGLTLSVSETEYLFIDNLLVWSWSQTVDNLYNSKIPDTNKTISMVTEQIGPYTKIKRILVNTLPQNPKL